ncbi:MAG: UDP-N-acetylglucosamine pyrophosphorylase [PVC group bacterium]
MNQQEDKIKSLINRGVRILRPETVEIGEEVDPDRISKERVTVYPGCRIYGEDTLIMAGAALGLEGPATIVNCRIGPGVELRGGFFKQSVFLERASLGSGAQIREGCLLEEESGGAHSIGLKQTILLPFVTLGSLINFCDCLMAGGTSRKDHSEVGSSFIHFNYTPNQDKATASLIGDVPRGVMLNQPPIFLGGQGGLVGPVRIGYGTVTAAGTILRKGVPEGGKLICEAGRDREFPFYPGLYREIREKTANNLLYIANLFALRRWYLEVRSLFLAGERPGEALHRGAVKILETAIEERIRRLRELAGKMDRSAELFEQTAEGDTSDRLLAQKRELAARWGEVEEALQAGGAVEGDRGERDAFLVEAERGRKDAGGDYLKTIKTLKPAAAAGGTRWLESIVVEISRRALDPLPSFR